MNNETPLPNKLPLQLIILPIFLDNELIGWPWASTNPAFKSSIEIANWGGSIFAHTTGDLISVVRLILSPLV